MMMDQNDSDGEDSFDERLEDAEVEDEDDEENESDHDEYSSEDDDSGGVEYDESDDEDEDDDGSGSEEDELKSEKRKQLLLTFRKGDYDDEIEDSLGENVGNATLAATHPAGVHLYNKPADWMERNAIGLENVKVQLQERTRYAEGGGLFNLELDHNIQRRIEEEPVVWHDPSIDPYWEQLGAAATLFPISKNVCIVCIENIEMRKETVAILVRSLCAKFVRFTNVNLCREGVVLLSTLVEQSSSLQTLALCYNRIGNMNSVLCLSMALKAHPNIVILDMSHCDLGNDPEILSVILQSDVKNIYLCHNNIDSSGAVKISEYLEGNPPIEELVLDNNDFNDDDAFLISQALKKNTNLGRLHLCSNNFTPVGVKALLTSLFDGTSLNAISDSNHTCELDVFICFDLIQKLFGSLNEDLDRTTKILIALHDKESLLGYLANVPVELMPDVLVFIQRESDRMQSISMMYAAMRWWNMPSLYSYRCCVSSNTKRKRDDNMYSD